MTALTAPPPSVAVVIPVKNDAAALRRCLRALARQSRTPDEIIVVDNGSTDDSPRVARVGGARVVRCETPGIPAAASVGYDAAQANLVLRMDADCVPDDTWVETVARVFDIRPEISVLTGGARFIDGPAWLRAPLAAAYLASYALVGSLALGHLPLYGSNLAFRRSAWLRARSQVHRDDARLHDDFDLAFHLGEHHRIHRLSEAVMGVSMRPFADARAFGRRIGAGYRSVLVHWPQDFPPVRWTRLLLRSALHDRERAR